MKTALLWQRGRLPLSKNRSSMKTYKGNLNINIQNGKAEISVACMENTVYAKSIFLGPCGLLNKIRISKAVAEVLRKTPSELVHDILDKDYFLKKKIEANKANRHSSSMTVIGLGGCGCNLIEYAAERQWEQVYYVVCDADRQALESHQYGTKLLLDRKEDITCMAKRIVSKKLADNTQTLVISAGMGAGIGSSLAPAVARLAKEKGIRVLAMVTYPFDCAGKENFAKADSSISELKNYVDDIQVLDNGEMSKPHSDCILSEFFEKGSKAFLSFVRDAISTSTLK